jgi:hypothetical protein
LAAAGVLTLVVSGCVLNVSSYTDSNGSIVYVGEALNQGDPLAFPRVEGTFYDASGNVITTASGPACRVMPKQSLAAFKVVLPPGTAQPARVEWKLTGETIEDAGLAEGLSGQLLGTGPATLPQTKPAQYGEMRNDSTREYRRGYVCIAWKNVKGEVIRVATGVAAGVRFNPGDVLPFVVYEDVPPEATAVEFYLDAGVALPPNTPTKVIELPGSAFQNALRRGGPPPGGGPGTMFLGLGEIRNTSDSTLYLEMSAVTRSASGSPDGVSTGANFCRVPAAPGGFTYGGYVLNSASSPAPPLELKIEGEVVEPGEQAILEVNGISRSGSGASVKVKGAVRNTSGKTLQRVYVCAGVYDASGTVIGAFPGDANLPAAGLAPNATVDVTVDVPVFGDGASAKMIAAGTD